MTSPIISKTSDLQWLTKRQHYLVSMILSPKALLFVAAATVSATWFVAFANETATRPFASKTMVRGQTDRRPPGQSHRLLRTNQCTLLDKTFSELVPNRSYMVEYSEEALYYGLPAGQPVNCILQAPEGGIGSIEFHIYAVERINTECTDKSSDGKPTKACRIIYGGSNYLSVELIASTTVSGARVFCLTDCDDESCFSGTSSLEVKDKGLITMESLEIGDFVRGHDGTYSQIYSFGHKDPEAHATFHQIETADSMPGKNNHRLVLII